MLSLLFVYLLSVFWAACLPLLLMANNCCLLLIQVLIHIRLCPHEFGLWSAYHRILNIVHIIVTILRRYTNVIVIIILLSLLIFFSCLLNSSSPIATFSEINFSAARRAVAVYTEVYQTECKMISQSRLLRQWTLDNITDSDETHTHTHTCIQSINQSFICSERHKKQVNAQCMQCRTGHKGMKHLQVPETKPNNKKHKKSPDKNNATVSRQWLGLVIWYTCNMIK